MDSWLKQHIAAETLDHKMDPKNIKWVNRVDGIVEGCEQGNIFTIKQTQVTTIIYCSSKWRLLSSSSPYTCIIGSVYVSVQYVSLKMLFSDRCPRFSVLYCVNQVSSSKMDSGSILLCIYFVLFFVSYWHQSKWQWEAFLYLNIG